MATTTSFKPVIDIPDWRPLAYSPAYGTNVALFSDLRNDGTRHPELFLLGTATAAYTYNTRNDGWQTSWNPAHGGGLTAGCAGCFAPSHGVRGTIASGATSSSFTPSASLGSTPGINQFAGRGGGKGYPIRIIDNGSGGSGKTEVVYISGNTSSTTPLINLSSSLSFTPVAGSSFEFLSGRAYTLNPSTTYWKYYDLAMQTVGTPSQTNLAASGDSSLVCLDEQYVPYNLTPGSGFLVGTATYNNSQTPCLALTAISSSTLTGQSSGGDAAVLANEYRNFQIRIVQDTTTPTAAGQRRRISSHTAGPSAVYTLSSAWTVTPSTSALYVIENNNDILLFTGASTSTYSYAWSGTSGTQTADSWSLTAYASRGVSIGTGICSFQPFGMALDTNKNNRYSYIFSFRGAGTSTLDILDIAGASTGSWSTGVTYGNSSAVSFNTGYTGGYDPVGIAPITGENSTQGQWFYIATTGANCYRFNANSRTMMQWAQVEYSPSGSSVGQKVCCYNYYDPSDGTKIGFTYMLVQGQQYLVSTLNQV